MEVLRLTIAAYAKNNMIVLTFGIDIIRKESGKNTLYDQIFEIGAEDIDVLPKEV